MDDNHLGNHIPGIRASDAERERTAEALKQHFLDGRLTSDEYAERLDTVYAARTRQQLDRLLRDLPPPEPVAPVQPGRRWWRGISPPAAAFALLATLWLVAWAAGDGPRHGFVPIWPLLIWSFVLLRWR